ncbi:uncharacterized protein [Clytia hemisphaerica]|uniref:Elongator complex protein 5 n=1 Tax=Clytia hemisphaerica TaxID=252671 RepID=A0A7M5VBI2_9CNID|eukprot:TCONS_00019785-protein
MFQSVLNGKEKSSFNIILDTNQDQCLKYMLLNTLGNSNKNLIIGCYQESCESYAKKLRINKRIYYDDQFENYKTLMNQEKRSISNVKETMVHRIRNSGVQDIHSSVLFIDDVILFGRLHGLVNEDGEWDSSIFRTLVDVSKDIPIFLYVKPSLISEANIRALKYYCSFYAEFYPSQTFALEKRPRCECILRKKSGKIVGEKMVYEMDKFNQLKLSKLTDLVNPTITNEEEVDPTSNLTFNLRLTEAEKQAKSNTVLPYLIDDENKSLLLGDKEGVGLTSKGGEIHYTPDDFDDFDEEDPDDDLDI